MRVMQERDREFFEPLWRRIVMAALLAAWTAWEWSQGETVWGVITAGAMVYFIWVYLITFRAGRQAKE